jgi:diguanylate cyclase (GGDEF)-like protein
LKHEVKRRAAAEAQIDVALTNMHHGLSMFDAGQRLVICNDRYIEMYGLDPEVAKAGVTLRQILEHAGGNRLPKGVAAAEYENELLNGLGQNSFWVEVRELNDGRTVSIAYRRLHDGGWVSTHEDITERRRIEQQMAYMAHHDALTGLSNRVMFRHRLESMMAGVGRGEALAVLSLDLDRFKEINDTLGHAMGDALLRVAADRLRQCVRETDLVARMGGDEFSILQPLSAMQPTEAAALAARVIEAISAPFELDGHRLAVGTSIGIAVSPNDGTDPDLLLRNADLALYGAKSERRGTFRFFESEMDQRMQARRGMERDLRNALVNGEFELHYQPIMDLRTNSVPSVEALVRWNHPERGRISPGEFIPLAEETGLIVPLGEWVLREACNEAARWPAHVSVAVNLSAVQFRNLELGTIILRALASSNLPAHRLGLEVTESVLLQDGDNAISILEQLRKIGVKIALDDFGTGYSSLGYLRRFRFDKLKIDRCFISDLAANADGSLAILRAIVHLGASLGMTTTAEGVETNDQLEMVRSEGCTEMQGYYFSAPKPASDMRKLLLELEKSATAA